MAHCRVCPCCHNACRRLGPPASGERDQGKQLQAKLSEMGLRYHLEYVRGMQYVSALLPSPCAPLSTPVHPLPLEPD